MSFDLLSLHFTVTLSLADFARNFAGAPGAIFAISLWSFRTIWRAAR